MISHLWNRSPIWPKFVIRHVFGVCRCCHLWVPRCAGFLLHACFVTGKQSRTHMSEGADAALRLRMSLSLGALSCRALTWNASGAKRSTGISTWCSMARLHTCTFLSTTTAPFASGHTSCRGVKFHVDATIR